MSVDWYEIVKSRYFEQGDILIDCPIVIPEPTKIKKLEEKPIIDFAVEVYDVILLTQSCDLRWGKVDPILMCPIFPLELMLNGIKERNKKKTESLNNEELEKYLLNYKNNLRRGYQSSYHMLNKNLIFSNIHNDYIIVDFSKIYSVSKKQIKATVGITKNNEGIDRIRLKSPFREHLAQSFARFFMRVGLPMDIPNFE